MNLNTTETFTLQDGILEQHPHAESINLLKSIGEHTIAAINANVPVSPVPYDVSPHMDLNTRIKVLTRRITIHFSEIPRSKGCSPTHFTNTSIYWSRPVRTIIML